MAGHRASDGADGATDQCSGERTAAGKGGYSGACSGPDQSARGGAVARAIATIGKSESEASQDERRRNTARHGVSFLLSDRESLGALRNVAARLYGPQPQSDIASKNLVQGTP